MNSKCFNLIIAVVFLQVCTWVIGEEDFSQFEQQFKQLNEALSGGGGGGVDNNGTASIGMPKDEPAAVGVGGNPVEQPAADQPPVEPTRPPKPEEGSTFPPLSRNVTEPSTTTPPPPTKATTPKGDGGADFCGANIALVLGVACVLHLLY